MAVFYSVNATYLYHKAAYTWWDCAQVASASATILIQNVSRKSKVRTVGPRYNPKNKTTQCLHRVVLLFSCNPYTRGKAGNAPTAQNC